MRQIVLDTETTGLEPAEGHRIIEIGCVEVINRRLTGNNYHRYLQPDREIDDAAIEVHGITNEFLADKPRFNDVAQEFLEYIKGAELVIHNAAFDVGFMDYEFAKLGNTSVKTADICKITDTLAMAKKIFPGKRNNLDVLCERYGIDNSHRTLHGALLDAEILADVFLLMTGGQTSLQFSASGSASGEMGASSIKRVATDRKPLKVLQATADEIQAHEERLGLVSNCLWGQ